MEVWNLLLFHPIVNALIFLYKVLFSNLGLAIIALTGIVRLILIPLTTPQLESAKKMQDLAPELEKLKSKFKDDKQKLAQAQMELYKKHGINPAAGCLPQIIQMIILITLYQAFNLVIKPDGIKAINDILYSFNRLSASSFNFNFLYLNLAKPDLIALNNALKIPGLFVILATVFQFLSSKLMMPALKKEEQITVKTETKQDDMSVAMQKNMMYMFPAMTLIFGYTMPSGVMLYWFIFSLFSFIQQMIVNNKQKRLVVKND